MGAVFISYRRGDSSGTAGRLYDRLVATFGRSHVFMDVDSIEPGLDFVEVLDRHLEECDVLLAVVGPGWLTATDAVGRRRIDDEADFVRLEVAEALSRRIRVIPILVDGAVAVAASDLPDDLRPLARRQAIEIRHERFGSDVDQLSDTLRQIMGGHQATPAIKAIGPIGAWQGQIQYSTETLKRTWILQSTGAAESPHNEFGFVETGTWIEAGTDIVVRFDAGTVYRGKITGDAFVGFADSATGQAGRFAMRRLPNRPT